MKLTEMMNIKELRDKYKGIDPVRNISKVFRFLTREGPWPAPDFMAFMPTANGTDVNILVAREKNNHQLNIMNVNREGANEVWRSGRDDGYEILDALKGYERLNHELGIYGLPSVLAPSLDEHGEILTVLTLAEVDEAQERFIIAADRAGKLRKRLSNNADITEGMLNEARDLRKLIQGQKDGKHGSFSMEGITTERARELHAKGFMNDQLYKSTTKRLTGYSPKLIISDDPEASWISGAGAEGYGSGLDADTLEEGYGLCDGEDDFDGYST